MRIIFEGDAMFNSAATQAHAKDRRQSGGIAITFFKAFSPDLDQGEGPCPPTALT